MHLLWVSFVGHLQLTAKLLLEELLQSFGVVASEATCLWEDVILDTIKELSQSCQRHVLVDQAKGENASRAGAHDDIKQVGDSLSSHALKFAQDLDLNESSHSAAVHAEDPITPWLRAKLNWSCDTWGCSGRVIATSPVPDYVRHRSFVKEHS